ncbi:MAG: dockerin type I repeat-containing protein, partial [Porcipelethomonas sp.]
TGEYSGEVSVIYTVTCEHIGSGVCDYCGEVITLPGDVNEDGVIDVFDAIQVAQYTVGKKSLTAQQLLAADMNGDSAIDVFDAIIIAKMTVA